MFGTMFIKCHLQVESKLESFKTETEQTRQVMKCDEKEAKKLMSLKGDSLVRYAASLAKRAKFVSRMDSYNYKTKA